MRLTPLALALALPAGAGFAQSLENCPGGDLSNCTVDTNPPQLESLREGTLDIQADTGDSPDNRAIEEGSTLRGSYREIDPEGTGLQVEDGSAYYDTGASYVRTDAETGEVLEVRRRGAAGSTLQPNDLRGSAVTPGADGVPNDARADPPGAPDGTLERNVQGDAPGGLPETAPGTDPEDTQTGIGNEADPLDNLDEESGTPNEGGASGDVDDDSGAGNGLSGGIGTDSDSDDGTEGTTGGPDAGAGSRNPESGNGLSR